MQANLSIDCLEWPWPPPDPNPHWGFPGFTASPGGYPQGVERL